MKKSLLIPAVSIYLLLLLNYKSANAQLVINELSNRNNTQIADEDNEYHDWIELYNNSNTSLNLGNYAISDDTTTVAWQLPNRTLSAHAHVLLFASGKNRIPSYTINHWETAINASTTWRYLLPTTQPSATWKNTSFNDATWQTGAGGIGYGDSDDATITANGTVSVYMRKTFTVTDTSALKEAILNIDYDDGFVAYLNGTEIARSGLTGVPPAYNESATDHEAVMYNNGLPEAYTIGYNTLKTLIIQGTNVLAVEVHNASSFSSDLSAIPFLSFGISNANSYFGATPSWFVPPTESTANLHTNFRIDRQGETIFLKNTTTQQIENQYYVAGLELDYSVGRTTDGANTWSYFTTATPNATNNTSTAYSGYEPAPTFSVQGGFFQNNVTVSITNNSVTGTLRYTLDGENPKATSPIYNGAPANLAQTTTVKVQCFSNTGLLPSPVVTNTYFINDFYAFPVINITSDSNNWVGNTGIYTNFWGDDKKPCYVEYYDTARNLVFKQNGSIKIEGGYGGSRSNAQKSFRVELKNDLYGDGEVSASLIQDKKNIKEYANFYLRNGSNYWNTQPYRDAFIHRSMRNNNNNYSAMEPVIVFLNGQYWGVYEFREKLDEYFVHNNLGGKEDETDILSMSAFYGVGDLRVVEGSDTGFYNMHNYVTTTSPTNPNYVPNTLKMLDIPNFFDYTIAESWFANVDWLYNNMKIMRSRAGDNKWNYTLQDLELGLGAWVNVYHNGLDYALNGQNPNAYSQILKAMIQNTTLKNYLLNRYADLMNTDFLPATMQAYLDDLHAQVKIEMPRQYARWISTNSTQINDALNTYDNYYYSTLDFINNRSQAERNNVESLFGLTKQVTLTLNTTPAGAGKILINTIVPDTYPWNGVYFDGVPVKLTAIPNPGYTFVNWNSNTFISNINVGTFTNNITSNQTFTANFTGSSAPPTITIGEINYNSESTTSSGDWIELYNYGTKPTVIGNWKVTDASNNTYTIPPHTVIDPNDRLVLVYDLVKFKQQFPNVNNYLTPSFLPLNNASDHIQIFDANNTLIVDFTYQDTWYEATDGNGYTLELKNTDLPLNLATTWFVGCLGGSPGQAYTPCTYPIAITEINYNSDTNFNPNDFVEIKNNSNAAINLSGWLLTTNNIANERFVIPNNTTLAPNAYLVLTQTASQFHCKHPQVTNYIGSFNFNLSGNGDNIRLYNANNTLKYSMVYNDTAPFPTQPDGNGYTLEITDINKNPNDPTNWFSGCYGGSPGVQYTLNCIPPTPVDNIAITGGVTICDPTTSYTYNTTAINAPNITYNWVVTNGTIISGQNTPTVQVQWNTNPPTGSINVTVTAP